MSDVQPGANWRVSDVQQTTRVTPSGRFEDVFEYTVETAWGGSFRVQVPTVGADPTIVASVIEQQYQALTATRFLSG